MSRLLVLAFLVACGPVEEKPVTTTGTTEPCLDPVPWYYDGDDDGYGDPDVVVASCDPVLNSVLEAGDCDDTDILVNPGMLDGDCDGFDNNCNGIADENADTQTWYADIDGDGVGGPLQVEACSAPTGFTGIGGDCDDADDTVFPTAPELCNGIDDDCDGYVPVDELDDDGDGYRTCEGDCDDLDPTRSPAMVEVCNRVDDDCDLAIPYEEFDLDGDTQTPCEGDCDDSNPLIFAGSFEVTADGVDGDCDGLELCFLDADGDGVGALASILSADLDCDDANEASVSGDCDDGDPLIGPTSAEVPYDGIDNDCDPTTPDDDLDGDTWGVADDCDDLDPGVNPSVIVTPVFTDVTVTAGLWVTSWDDVLNPAYCGTEGMSAGASAADFDGDGWVDLFVPRMHDGDQLFRNQGDGTFVDVAVAWGIDHAGTSGAGTFFDMDGDADLDLFVTSSGSETNRLYRNDGTTFTEVVDAGGMAMPLDPGLLCSVIYGASAADIDADGDLDIHTQQWHVLPGEPGDRSRVWLNDGAGNFTDGTAASGLDLTVRAAFATSFGDVDGDGNLDAAIAADWGESGLWLGDGSGVYTEVTGTAGVGLDRNGMGSDLGDVDNDGDLDWFVTAIYDAQVPCPVQDWDCDGNFLYLNDGTGTFTDGTDAAGVRNGDWGWGTAFFDFDNDGDLDLGMTNGFHLDPVWQDDPVRLWDNDGTGVFSERSCELRVDLPGEGKGFVPFDFDNDGDLDVFTTVTRGEPRLYRNDGGDQNSWLIVEASEPGNPFGVGATVWVEPVSGGTVMRRDIHANSAFMSGRAPRAHFGLGAHEAAIHEVRVQWADGTVTAVPALAPRQTVTIQR